MNSDIYNTLSIEDKKIAENYVRFCIRGKRGRTVPVLLSQELFHCVTEILKWRKEADVPSKNPYIFGLPDVTKDNRYKHLKACGLMRKFAEECNPSDPETLRGTILRKQIATYCVQLNLNDAEVSELATFMGHADKIHKQHYRQPQASRDILKISQYLEAVVGKTQNSRHESSLDNEVENLNDSFNISNDINDCTDTIQNVSPCVTEEASTSYENQDENQKTPINKKRKRSTSPYKKTKKVRWTEDEKEAVLRAFAKHMENLTLPSLKEIQQMKKKYTLLANRTSPQIKTWIHKQKTLKHTCQYFILIDVPDGSPLLLPVSRSSPIRIPDNDWHPGWTAVAATRLRILALPHTG
ncbi:uncharacterized protein [Temnothorax nylanderi]|uniref:uncharacterized protein n=1 Tax=Temnothorax nylanderi TaxID=102681 RepID=UPI003A8A72B5